MHPAWRTPESVRINKRVFCPLNETKGNDITHAGSYVSKHHILLEESPRNNAVKVKSTPEKNGRMIATVILNLDGMIILSHDDRKFCT